MGLYKVTVTETYGNELFVKANSAKEAEEIIEKAWWNQEIKILDQFDSSIKAKKMPDNTICVLFEPNERRNSVE